MRRVRLNVDAGVTMLALNLAVLCKKEKKKERYETKIICSGNNFCLYIKLIISKLVSSISLNKQFD